MGRSSKSHAPAAKHGKAARKMQNFTRLSTTANPKSKARDSRGKPDQGGPKKKKKQQRQQQQQRKPVIPFRPSDRILLVGEGDFSFSASLAKHHGCHRILATCYDNEHTVHQKYPQARQNISQLRGLGTPDPLLPSNSGGGVKRKRDNVDDDDDGDGGAGKTITATTNHKHDGEASPLPKVLFSIDARKLGASPGGGGKLVRKGFPRNRRSTTSINQRSTGNSSAAVYPKTSRGDDMFDGGPWDVICFNFPHVGGLSTDVNRQVRANQEVLVSFFKACEPLLSPPPPSGEHFDDDDDQEYDSDEYSDLEGDESDAENRNHNKKDRRRDKTRSEPGQIIVTLFEGEPYTLWNIRDLARHVGLRVVTSFEFPWTSYPGYSHARTVGEIESKKGGRGGWRGEDRQARSFVFERKDHEPLTPKASGKKRKEGSEDDSDD